MARRPVKKTASGAKKATTKVKAAAKKTAKKLTPRSSKRSPAPARRHGDVLGVSSARVPKSKTAPKKSAGTRKRKSIGVVKRATGIEHLNRARVRG